MRILAVIPARAGSKGIPNKNVRLIAGYPMIHYAIKNAIDSEYITDIVVSTDSAEIGVIAKQMGVNIKNRDKELCSDDVTLDSVVYDVVSEYGDVDYVVTLQPTSPTLKVETLDNAIRYTIENDLDTVISGINCPHLSWSEKNGEKIPNYTERLNRQYLPKHYQETGAFVVSKIHCINLASRIGKKVEIFEISEEEAIDIDNFSDLILAEQLFKKEKIAIYVNGNNTRGVGHVYRALEIADEFKVKPDIYFDKNQTDIEIFGNTTHNLIAVNGIADLFEKCKHESYTLFINDILTTSIDYMIGLKSVLPKAKIINFEDDGEGILKADLVFNALYQETSIKNVYYGEKYYISSKTFMFYNPIEIKENVKNIFISFGGADPQNYSDRLLKIISKPEYREYNFVVVLGRAKKNVNELLKYNSYENISVLYDIANMPELMSQCDIGITSRGRTGYELAILGIPSIAMAQNKREEKHGFVCNENGFDYIGLNPEDEIIEGNLQIYLKMSKNTRQNYQNILLSHDLRGGRKRVMSLINNL